MNEKDFKKNALEYGYSDEEINDFIELHNESGIEYDDFILEKKIVD